MTDLILYCNHCGNTSGNILLCEAPSSSTAYSIEDSDERESIECTYYLTRCKTCGGISLYYDCEYDEHPGYITEAFLCYPAIKELGEEIPIAITRTYYEALKAEKFSSDASAILIRRALELLCKDQQANGRNLKAQLDDLAHRNIIPNTLVKMGDALRILGNLSAHATDYKIDASEVYAMKDFLFAMLEYVYTAPTKIDKLQKSMAAKTNNSA